MNTTTWPDGTPKSQDNAFNWRASPCLIDWANIQRSQVISESATKTMADRQERGDTYATLDIRPKPMHFYSKAVHAKAS